MTRSTVELLRSREGLILELATPQTFDNNLLCAANALAHKCTKCNVNIVLRELHEQNVSFWSEMEIFKLYEAQNF